MSAIGGGFHFVASYWITYTETESTESVAWLSIAFWAPALLTMPFAGVIVDRWNRRLLVAFSLANPALVNIGLMTLMLLGEFRSQHLYIYGVLTSTTHALFWNALTAYLQEHLSKEELLHANGINTALFNGGYLAGAGLAGVLYSTIGPLGAFAIDTVGLSMAVVGWFVIQRWWPDRNRDERNSELSGFLQEFREGLRAVRADLALFGFVLLAIVPRVSAQIVNVLQVGYSKTVLGAGSAGFGFLDMAYGVGAMLCGFAFPMLAGRSRRLMMFVPVALISLSAVYLGMSFVPTLAVAMVVQFGIGTTATIIGILGHTTLQREAPNHVIGRIMSIIQIVQYMLLPVIVWCIGSYANLARGRLLHESPLRDAFVLASLAMVVTFLYSCVITLLFVRTRGDDAATISESAEKQ